MAKDPSKPNLRARTEDLRREIEASSSGSHHPLRAGTMTAAAGIWLLFALIVGAFAAWTRERPLVDVGRVMSDTRTAAVRFSFADAAAKDHEREMARAKAPRVYVAVPGLIEEIGDGLTKLPQTVHDAATVEDVEPGIRQQFGIDAPALSALRAHAAGTGVTAQWRDMVATLSDALAHRPILKRDEAQMESQSLSKEMELRQAARSDGTAAPAPFFAPSAGAMNVESTDIGTRLRRLARDAGFEGPLLSVAVARLTQPLKPTFMLDAAATSAAQDAAEKRVPDQIVTYPEKEIIYRRGDVLTPAQADVLKAALRAEVHGQSVRKLWSQRAAVAGLVGAIALLIAGYTITFVPRIRRNPARASAVAVLLAATAFAACYATVQAPGLIALTAVAPTVFCTMILCVAYSQRVALAFGLAQAALVAVALDMPVTMFCILAAGAAASAWRLREIRDRDTLIKAGVIVGLVLAGVAMLANLIELPLTPHALIQAAKDAGWAGSAGLGVAMVMLFILPVLEKSFDITTGLTLIELRDPKQPLLRQLQQRAPGTYNHSLTVAALGEAAADAIGADGLLTYVGALYHDIGKMNKPDYFVENQTPGFNRHDKLSPAMSLLIIVGHVKDGLELAREFNLPRPLWHFIESHHGTTLVEYFYHRAKRRAEGNGGSRSHLPEDAEVPGEMEYRYPGPRPRMKEAAILMVCDAVESAARTMADPTPSRIDTLVRAIATKRLMDGQFDECDLTLRELNLIVEAVSRTLAAIHHARIPYPEEQREAGASGLNVPARTNGSEARRPAPASRSNVGAEAK